MEYDSSQKRDLIVDKTSKFVLATTKSLAIQNMKLQERFQKDAKLSYADFHHSITQNVEGILSGCSDYERSPRIEKNSSNDDEVVKYMSKLPAYLRRTENVQEKAFSVGVLDWGRLEKWQNVHKQILPRNTRYSTSCSSASSSSSTEVSSSNSSRGRSCSPIQQRMHRPTLQSHLLASPKGREMLLFDPFSETGENHSHNVNVWRNKLNGKLQDLEMVKSQNDEAVPCMGSQAVGCSGKDEEKLPESNFGSRLETLQGPKSLVVGPETVEKHNKVVILMPRGVSKQDASESAIPQPSDSQVNAGKRPVWMNGRGSVGNARLARSSRFHLEIPRPVSLAFDPHKQAQVKGHGSTDLANLKSEGFHRIPPLSRKSVSLSVGGTLDTRKPNAVPSALDPRLLRGPDLKANISSEKARSSSPLRRLGHSMAKIVKNSSSKEGSTGNQHDSARSGFEKTEPLSCQDTSVRDISTSAGRSRSSPLRRLLDPILRPKTSESYNCDNSLLRSSIPIDVLCKRAAGQSESINLQSAKMKLDLASCRTIDVNENSRQSKGEESLAVQALLRVASKNGLPLLTFAVNDDSDILAATVKNCSFSGKDNPGWTYTFFSIREVRKKNGGWITQGGKSKASNYVPNVVAHMKVSDIQLSALQHLEEDSFCLREFVLLGVYSAQQEQKTPIFQPHDELAAIITRTPVHTKGRISQNQCIGDCDPYPKENLQDRPSLGNGEFSSTTVILPSGIHSLPSRGGPSSLIERWRSGGSCDCGGWDMGCKLKILSSDDHLSRKLISAESSSEDLFSLFSQSDAQEEHPVFLLTPFKDKIYSVEFKSSLSVLQAFSICVAVLDSRKLIGSLEASNSSVVKSHDEIPQPQDGIVKPPERVKADSSIKYVSYPPLSPVGRV